MLRHIALALIILLTSAGCGGTITRYELGAGSQLAIIEHRSLLSTVNVPLLIDERGHVSSVVATSGTSIVEVVLGAGQIATGAGAAVFIGKQLPKAGSVSTQINPVVTVAP